jgi:hydrogenase nickel incorporation protein HypA/HybF
MHESGIAYDIYATSKRAAKDNGAIKIKTIYVDVGSMAMINPDQIKFMFETFVTDDPLFSETKLILNTVPPIAKCECGYSGSEIFVCPNCGKLPYLTQGREILVKNIEINTEE